MLDRIRIGRVGVAVVVAATSALVAVPPDSTSATVSARSPAMAAPSGGPNIILITTDDQAVEDLELMPFTRALLGDAGVTFTDAVAPFPLCCPARATILTGQLAHNHGVRANVQPYGGYPAFRPLGESALPVWLQAVGYDTTFTGKYLNGYGGASPQEVPPGWDSWNGMVAGIYDYYGATWNQDGVLVDMAGRYQPEIAQEIVEQRIRDAATAGRPFFVWQSNLAPHGACWPTGDGSCAWGPPMPAAADDGTFDDLPLATRDLENFNERVVSDKPAHIRALVPWGPARIQAATRVHRFRARSLQAVDRNVRDTVELLGELGQLEQTLIILTSDNGYLLGQHRYQGKVLPYESSLKVPMLMRGPGLPKGAVRQQTVALADLAPTIADAAGASPLLIQDGRSLLPLAQGSSTHGYAALSIEAGPQGAADEWFYQGVRTRRYTYVEYPATGELELYDRARDPDQLTNVAYRPTHAATRSALADLLGRLRACQGDPCAESGGQVPPPGVDRAPVHPDELGSIGSAGQVVTVTAPDWASDRGTVVAWQRSGRTWRVARGPFPVRLGRSGLVEVGEDRHQTGETPAGVFGPDRALGLQPDPGTPLPYRQLDGDDRWPYDPDAPRTYNVFQPRRSATATWRAALDVRFAATPRRFPYALVLDHNLPGGIYYSARFQQQMARVPADVRQGSFLLHAGETLGSHGWVSAGPERLRALIRWMEPGEQHTVFVVGTPRYLRDRL